MEFYFNDKVTIYNTTAVRHSCFPADNKGVQKNDGRGRGRERKKDEENRSWRKKREKGGKGTMAVEKLLFLNEI